MGLETASYITQLVPTNPVVGDDVSQGDDHLRMLKTVLQTNFPNASKAFYLPSSIAEQAGAVTVTGTDDGKVIPVNADAAPRLVSLPAAPVDGFRVTIVKTDDDTANAVTIDPSGATLINGESTISLTREFESAECVYLSTYGAWLAMRSTGVSPFASTDVTPIAQGGTGQITAAAAFDALSTPRADVASGATLDLDTNNSGYLRVTGTTTITAITLAAGRKRLLLFADALTLTHGASLILPSAANIVTVAGDLALVVGEAAGVVRCVSFMRASGASVALDSTFIPARSYAEYDTNTDITASIPRDDTAPQDSEGLELSWTAGSNEITLRRATSRIRATFMGWGECRSAQNDDITAWIAALFLDGTASALKTAMTGPSASNVLSASFPGTQCLAMEHEFAPGSVGPHTVNVNVGVDPQVAGATLRLNGFLTGRAFGGTSKATLILQEIFVP
jgi:hypothetical protein